MRTVKEFALGPLHDLEKERTHMDFQALQAEEELRQVWALDILIRKISLDPIGLHGQGAIVNYIPKFQVATMSLEVA